MYKAWLIVVKKEMTKIWKDDKFVPVTMVKILPQEIIRYKTNEKDGYVAAVIGVDKKIKNTPKWEKVDYRFTKEMRVVEDFVASNEAGKVLDASSLEGINVVTVVWVSKWKWFQWVMKRHHAHGMPATHGHKFTRVGWSKGNRKPRRVQKWHPHAGHMWMDRITLKDISILDIVKKDNEQLLVLKWSLPGSYNWFLTLLSC